MTHQMEVWKLQELFGYYRGAAELLGTFIRRLPAPEGSLPHLEGCPKFGLATEDTTSCECGVEGALRRLDLAREYDDKYDPVWGGDESLRKRAKLAKERRRAGEPPAVNEVGICI